MEGLNAPASLTVLTGPPKPGLTIITESHCKFIDVFRPQGEPHETAFIPAMTKPQDMGDLMKGNLDKSLINKGRLNGFRIVAPIQTEEGNHGSPAVYMGFAEHVTENRQAQIPPHQAESQTALGNPLFKRIENWNGIVLPAGRDKCIFRIRPGGSYISQKAGYRLKIGRNHGNGHPVHTSQGNDFHVTALCRL
jgi:hypothetical protein